MMRRHCGALASEPSKPGQIVQRIKAAFSTLRVFLIILIPA
jgi:hypothetical protein